MTEDSAPDPVVADPPPAADPAVAAPAVAATEPPPRRGGNGLLWLLVLALLAAVAWLGWHEWQRMGAADASSRAHEQELAALADRSEALEQKLDQALAPLTRGQRTIEQRLADTAATNTLLREEVLAVAERAGLMEDALARLADQRLRGELLLRLNEAEFLLLLGAERLELFGDVATTLQAYRLADGVLASMDDPLAATLRDTLARELDTLADLPRDPARAAQAALDSVAAALPGLPPRGSADSDDADAEAPSRIAALLSHLVTVRRVADDDGAVLDPVLQAANRAALELDIATARAAAERADANAYTSALMRAERHLVALFDPASPRVADVRQQLAAAAAIELAPELPVLGATLRELRALRGSRQPPAPVLRDSVPLQPAPAPRDSDALDPLP